jgi:hypothetical protein
VKKYRAGKVKREHSVIERLWPVLEEMAECDAISSIIPGPISAQRSKGFEITFQRFTETGIRLLAKNGNAVQEIWVVASDPQAALDWLADRELVTGRPRPARQTTKPAGLPDGPPMKSITAPSDLVCQHCGKLILAGSRAMQTGRKPYQYYHVRCVK